MSFPIEELPTEIGVKELSPDEAVEILVAQTVQGKVAGGRQAGFDVYKSLLLPDTTFQVKYARASLRRGEAKSIGDRPVEIRDRWTWTFTVAKADYIADWYVLFGEREGQVYPFLLSYAQWLARSTRVQKQRILNVAAQEYSKCGRYESAYKRNRTWKYHISDWSQVLDRIREHRPIHDEIARMEQLELV